MIMFAAAAAAARPKDVPQTGDRRPEKGDASEPTQKLRGAP
jgi:hypothetical protein